ncbi:hypothetical protein [Hymenobacter ruricola]|uniref:Prolyl-tRNA synthetase n=1 Tax=Hymenobacter ruricola TaxID=2791023 RepID=A0ABS0I7C8_9BACT|nr:hypothetical protein [Hymenobacter ruricola]MBF9222855.1 hypothetical protein [Hymenobacter ruricola]
MKNLLTALLPAMALLALGGCASTSAIATSEDDGVYYSSKDRTTAVVSASPAPASTDEAANPDYNGSSQPKAAARQGSGSTQYYDNTYTYMQGVPSYGPGLAYYTPYSPYTSLSYGWGGGACGYSPYAYGFADPFYSPVYSPFYSPYYGYGSGLSISFGFGRPWGYGSYYGRPYGYGYAYGGYGGFYDPYYYGGPFYGGYYGRGGYYGSSYYGGNYGYSNGYYGNDGGNGRGRTSGHRNDRSSDGRVSSGGRVAGSGGGTSAPSGGGRVRDELRPQQLPASPSAPGVLDAGRTRTEVVTSAPGSEVAPAAEGRFNRPRSLDNREQAQSRGLDQLPTGRQPLDSNPGQGQITRENTRGRWRNTEAATQMDAGQPAASQPQESQRRRGGFFQSMPAPQPNTGGDQAVTEQPQRRQQRTFEQPQQRSYEQPQRTFEQPQQRSYEAPQRSYEAPQRSYSQPSYSAPSNGGGGGGGGGGHSRGRAD